MRLLGKGEQQLSRRPRIVALLALLFGTLLMSSVGATSATASDGRLGALLNNNELWVKDGNYGAQWTQIATGAKSFSMDGNRIGYLTTAGVAYGKEGNSLTSPWINIGPAGQQSLTVGAYPPRTMIVNPAENLYVQEGPYATAPGGVYLAGRVGPTAAADGRLAFINTDSIAMRTLEGPLNSANWNFQLIGSTEIALTGHRIVTLLNNGELWAKSGTQDDQWYLLRTNVAHIAATGTRVAAIDTNGKLYVMDRYSLAGVTSADWLYEVSAASNVALDNDRIGVVLNNGELWLKEGNLSSPWIFELNGAVKVDLAHRDVTGPAISVSGSLRDAPSPVTNGNLNITLDDNTANYSESGAAGYTLSDGGTVIAQQTRTYSNCAFYWCAAQALQSSITINPVALGWATGVHHLALDAWDLVGNHTTTGWDVTYYKTSWTYGGGDGSVNTDQEARAVSDAQNLAADGGAALWAGLSPADQSAYGVLNPSYDPAAALGANDDLTGGSTGAFDPVATASATEPGYLTLSLIGCSLHHDGLSFPDYPYWAGDYTIFGCTGQVQVLHVGWDFLRVDGSLIKHYNNNNVGVVNKAVANPIKAGYRYQKGLKKIHKGTVADGEVHGLKICIEAIPWGYPGAQKGRVCNTVLRVLQPQ